MSDASVPSTSSAIDLPGPARQSRAYALRDLLTAVCYHKRVMLAAFLIPVALAIASAASSRPAFVAQARLLVLYGSEYFYRPAAGQPGESVALDRNEIMNGELQVLRSAALATATLRAVGPDKVYPGTRAGDPAAEDRAAQRFLQDLTVASLPQSNVLELSFRSEDPDTAADVLRALIAAYLDRRTAIFQRAPTTAAEVDRNAFLARLQQAEDALASFAQAHGIASIDQQINLLVQQQAANSQARDETAQAIGEASARLARLQQQILALPPTEQTGADSERSQASQILTEGLARLQVRRHDLASRYGEAFPPVQEVDRQIAAMQADLARVPSREASVVHRGVNSIYQDALTQEMALQTQLSGLQARQAQLATSATALQAQLSGLTRAARTYHDLQRNRDLLDDAYRTLVRSSNDAQIADAADRDRTANIRVVQPPERPGVGISLRRIIVTLGLVVGALAALAALAVANAARQVFVTSRDLAVGLDLPVLAVVPREGRGGQLRARPADPAKLRDLSARGLAARRTVGA